MARSAGEDFYELEVLIEILDVAQGASAVSG